MRGPVISEFLSARQLQFFINSPQFAANDVQDFKRQLDEIASTRVNQRFSAADDSEPMGQQIVSELLERCRSLADESLQR